MNGDQTTMDRAECSQPLCTAIQLAMINLLASCGIHPSKVIGHSSGEIAAAYASGAIPMETAIILAYYRGQVSSQCEGKGAMMAVGMGPKQVRSYITDGIVVACYNSPRKCDFIRRQSIAGRGGIKNTQRHAGYTNQNASYPSCLSL